MTGSYILPRWPVVWLVAALLASMVCNADSSSAANQTQTTALEQQVAQLRANQTDTNAALNAVWIMSCTFLVFYMQAGFTMVEVGSAQSRHSMNILVKNFGDAVIGVLVYWAVGYAFAYGKEGNEVIGFGPLFLVDTKLEELAGFTFQAAFSIASSTIVSGALVGRTRFQAYFAVTTMLTGFVFPVVSHWVWDGSGFLSSGHPTPLLGIGSIDFAGSGVVHLVGGVAAVLGAYAVGPRRGRLTADGRLKEIQGHSFVQVAMGTILLWFAWFGFNAGSSITVTKGRYAVAGLAAVNTLLGGAGAGVGMMILSMVVYRKLRLMPFLNAVLGGLVSVTAGCAVMPPWAAVVTGFLSAGVYWGGGLLEERFAVDDPVEAFPVHGMCGVWGMLSVGLFADQTYVGRVLDVAEVADFGVLMGGNGSLLTAQLAAVGCIVLWVGMIMSIVYAGLQATIGLRVEGQVERIGLNSEHDKTEVDKRRRIWGNYLTTSKSTGSDDSLRRGSGAGAADDNELESLRRQSPSSPSGLTTRRQSNITVGITESNSGEQEEGSPLSDGELGSLDLPNSPARQSPIRARWDEEDP